MEKLRKVWKWIVGVLGLIFGVLAWGLLGNIVKDRKRKKARQEAAVERTAARRKLEKAIIAAHRRQRARDLAARERARKKAQNGTLADNLNDELDGE